VLSSLASANLGKGPDGNTHSADCVTPSDMLIMIMMVGRWDLQLKMGSGTRGGVGGTGILYIPKILSLLELEVSICEEQNFNRSDRGN
jgi:hypothetical protein